MENHPNDRVTGFKKANNVKQAPEWDHQGTYSVMDELAPAFANPVESTTLDRKALANLAESQASNCVEIGRLCTELAATKKALGEVKQASKGKTRRTNRKLHYSWSHGFRFNPDHTSCSCINCCEGHIEGATSDNIKRGNSRNAPGE